MPSIDRADPPYMQVAQAIRTDITSGKLTEGDVVPSARQLAAAWGIALATATRALGVLRTEGLVLGRPGVGTVVASATNQHHSPQDWSIAVHRTGRIYPVGHYARVASAELVTGPEQIVTIFGLDTGAVLIRRRRTTFDQDDRPVSTSTSWFDGSLQQHCPRLLETERLVQGTSGYIAEQTGRTVRSGHDWFAAGNADSDTAAALDLEAGSPVLLAQNRWLDQDEVVIEVGESVSPPYRWAFYPYTTTDEDTP